MNAATKRLETLTAECRLYLALIDDDGGHGTMSWHLILIERLRKMRAEIDAVMLDPSEPGAKP